MLNLNKDVLFLIFEEFQGDRKSLHPCLLVNKTLCEIIIPILWKNPWKCLDEKKKKSQLNVIVSHLSNETKENLKSQGINLFSGFVQQKPSFNYISYCRYLSLYKLEQIISTIDNIEESKISMIRSEILKLFINRNTRFTHLYISSQTNYQIHLIPGAEHCFSRLKFLKCDANNNQNILEGLARIIKSIKELGVVVESSNNNTGIFKLIEAQQNLNNVCFTCYKETKGESFCKTLVEESLIKHAGTVQYLKIGLFVNKILVNLDSVFNTNWSLENISLPMLKTLKIQQISPKCLTNLIKNTKGHLNEISIDYCEGDDKFIQVIYQNCPILKYLKLSIKNHYISELEKLLNNCKYLNGLIIKVEAKNDLDWDNLFKALTKSSPTSLFKFKFNFYFIRTPKLESLKLFFDNWKGRQPMLLQTIPIDENLDAGHFDLIEKYKKEGIVKKYDNVYWTFFEEFEWIRKKF